MIKNCSNSPATEICFCKLFFFASFVLLHDGGKFKSKLVRAVAYDVSKSGRKTPTINSNHRYCRQFITSLVVWWYFIHALVCFSTMFGMLFGLDGWWKKQQRRKLSHMRGRATVKNKFTHTGVVDVVFLDSKRVRNRMNSHSVQITSFNIVFRIVGVCGTRVWLHDFHVPYVSFSGLK